MSERLHIYLLKEKPTLNLGSYPALKGLLHWLDLGEQLDEQDGLGIYKVAWPIAVETLARIVEISKDIEGNRDLLDVDYREAYENDYEDDLDLDELIEEINEYSGEIEEAIKGCDYTDIFIVFNF